MSNTTLIRIGILLLLLQFPTGAVARLSPEELARLSADLTPLGAEKAGSEDGTIPPWTGGITGWPEGYEPGMHHPDPFADDEILFTITAKNMDRYKDKLTPGHQAMLRAYPSFKMNVYPTRRSASFPERIYAGTKKAAATALLVEGGNGVTGAVGGYPFPIPKNGLEAIWNHLLRYSGERFNMKIAQASPTRRGRYSLVKFDIDTLVSYYQEGMTEENLENRAGFFRQKIVAPAHMAGSILLVHEPLDQVMEPRQSWLYNPGQRRVRRAPHVAYDNPGRGSDGMRTNDQYGMFNGAPDRYDWKLVGKKELYVCYNSYELHSDSLKYEDILTPLHVNPEHLRYELHRVWVVEATLKEGLRHIYKRRTFYLDEDSWLVLHVDQYDSRDQLWRVSEAHPVNYYEVPVVNPTLEVHTDLQAGRYLAIGLDNESAMYDFSVDLSPVDFTPEALRREGRR